MIIKNIKDITTLIKAGSSVIESIIETVNDFIAKGCESELNLETNAVIQGAVSQDSDLEEFLICMGWSVIDFNEDYAILQDVQSKEKLKLPFVNLPNRHGIDLAEETFFVFNQCEEFYDKDAVYDAEIFPLMGQIIEICQKNGINMVASFALQEPDDEHESLMCTTCIIEEGYKPREIRDAFKVLQQGYVAQPPFLQVL